MQINKIARTSAGGNLFSLRKNQN